MSKNLHKQDYCLNCKETLAPQDTYCSTCGQKRTTGKVTLKILIADFFENIFSLNSKTFLTLRPLFFAPGKLTKEYFNGVHKKYISPIRLFVTFVAFHFIVFNFIFQPLNQIKVESANSNVDYLIYLDTFCGKVQPLLQDSADLRRVDSLCTAEVDLHQGYFQFSTKMNVTQREVLTENLDTLYKRYDINNLLDKIVLRQVIKFMKSPDSYGQYILGSISWVIFLMVPGFALILKLLYFRRKRYYIEHLVFGLHLHAFIFALLSLIYILIALFGSLPVFVILIFLLAFLSYVLFSMKRVFKQAWWKTFLKFILLLFLYTFLSIVLIAGMFIVGFIFF